jgi:hypothetical protein
MKEKSKREFPAVYEKAIPAALSVLAVGIVLVMLFAVLVALGVF